MAAALSLTAVAANIKNCAAPSTMRILLNKLTNPTYLSATLYWALRKLTGVQIHKVVTIGLNTDTLGTPAAEHLEISVLERVQDADRLPAGIKAQLDEQSGMPCRSLCERGTRLYFIHDGKDVACQLNIEVGEVLVDSPTPLRLQFQADHAFLNYLFTHDAYRGRGLARELIRYACHDLSKHGKRSCFAHIRATNFASLSAFRRSGWSQCGKIITTTSGRFLAALGCARSAINVEPINRA